MFNIGDKIVYPMHGAGTIDGIEQKKVLGEVHEYYVLKIPVGDMKVMVPINNIEEIGIREVSNEEEADRVIEIFKTFEEEDFESNWNKRYRDNIEKLRTGKLEDVAKIAKSLILRDQKKSLSNAERKMLGNTKHIMLSELVLAKKMPYEELENMLFYGV